MNMPIPRPGDHRSVQTTQDSAEVPDPESIALEVDRLLAELPRSEAHVEVPGAEDDTEIVSDLTSVERLSKQAHILERAHNVLVEALTAVDKI